MSGDLYPRPNREQIAAQVTAARRASEPATGPLKCFAKHLQGRMRALGWDQARLQAEAGIKTPMVAARAINGTNVELGLAAKIAAAVGSDLRAMLGPYTCATCKGNPPAGFRCLECGTEVTA